MDYVRLGKTGLKVSRICLGCMSFGVPDRGAHPWTLDEEKSRPLLQHAIELGINFLDTANSYSDGTSEEIVGRAIRDFGQRDEIVVATKLYFPWRKAPNTGGLSRKAIFAAAENSLKRLGTDYIDLYQIHRWDPNTPIEETVEALHDLVKSGKVRYLGASSMFAWQFAKSLYLADNHGWTRFVSMQPQYNLIYREEEREMLALCESEGVGVIPWSPLGRGKLTRPWSSEPSTARSGSDEYSKKLYQKTEAADRAVVDRLIEVAKAKNVPPSQMALAWVLSHPAITSPIIGASKMSHIDDAVAALSVTLTDQEKAALAECYTPHEVTTLV